MPRKIFLSKSFAVFLAILITSGFVQLHSILQANLMQYGYKFNMNTLPLLTVLYHRFCVAGYILPAIVLFSIIITRNGNQKTAIRQEALLIAIGLMSLMWLFGCLLAWQLPAYTPVAFVE